MAGTDYVSAAIADLYAGEPGRFTARRRELADQARAADDVAAAKAISGLHKPTRAAWAVNSLVHSDPSVAESLADLASKLRAGEAELDGAAIKELSRDRRHLIESLTRRALEHVGLPGSPAALREEVAATLTAALADPEVAADVAAGRVVHSARWTGFSEQIGSAARTVAPADGPREPPARRQRELAIEHASRAVAAARARADEAASFARQHGAIVSDIEERLGQARARAEEALRQAREAAADLDSAKQTLADLQRHGPQVD